MDRRQFLTRSAALVAISALPLPQAQAAVQPQLASGVVQGLTFHIKEPMKLILDGPLTFLDCRFVFDNSEAPEHVRHGIRVTNDPAEEDALLVVANPDGHQFTLSHSHLDMRKLHKGFGLIVSEPTPIYLRARRALGVA